MGNAIAGNIANNGGRCKIPDFISAMLPETVDRLESAAYVAAAVEQSIKYIEGLDEHVGNTVLTVPPEIDIPAGWGFDPARLGTITNKPFWEVNRRVMSVDHSPVTLFLGTVTLPLQVTREPYTTEFDENWRERKNINTHPLFVTLLGLIRGSRDVIPSMDQYLPENARQIGLIIGEEAVDHYFSEVVAVKKLNISHRTNV